MTITIDTIPYNINIVSLKRSADFLDKSAERTVDGVLHRELIGVFYNYQLSLSPGSNMTTSEYQTFWTAITAAEEFHTVIVPDVDGTPYSFTAYFAGVSDELRKDQTSKVYWKNLTINFISQSPSRTP
jgi:hypothetical protein